MPCCLTTGPMTKASSKSCFSPTNWYFHVDAPVPQECTKPNCDTLLFFPGKNSHSDASTFVAAPCTNSKTHPHLGKNRFCWQGQCILEFMFPSMNCDWWMLLCSKVATEIDIIVFFIFVMDWYVWCQPVKSVPGLSTRAGEKAAP